MHQRTISPLTRHANPHRYDARLLLDALPRIASSSAAPNDEASASKPRPDSPSGGWSDLPSDAEDTFFLTPDETTDLHRTKRLRHLDALRTARLRALSPDASPPNNNDTDPWGGTDEEVSKSLSLPKSKIATKLSHTPARVRIL